MTPVLKPFRDILWKSGPSRGLFRRFLRHWALFLAFLGRKLGFWRLWDDRKRGAFPKVKKTESSSPRTESSSREYEIAAASSIPESARYPSQRDDVLGTTTQLQRAASASSTPHAAEPSPVFDATINSSRRYTDSSIRSCSGDRLSIIRTHSGDSLHSHTPVNPSTQFPRAPHRQFGRGPSLPPSREASRSPSPIPRGHQSPHSEIDSDVANPHPEIQVDRTDSSVDSPSVTFDAHAQLSTLMPYGHHMRHSATSLVVDIENPSTDSLPQSFFADRPLLTEEPYSIGSPGDDPSPVADAPDAREGSPQHSPIASSPSATSNLKLPEGRFLFLINSEQVQVPRYTKEVTVPRERIYNEIPPRTTTFPYVPEQIGLEQDSLKEDCAPWVPATHPDGALYFFDQERRLFTDTDMHNPILREEMEDFYHCLQKILRHDEVDIPSTNYDLTLDIMPSEDGRIQWSYYYACHETRCLFWLDTYDANQMISELFGVRSPALIKHRIEALYWTHWSLFPTVFEGRHLVPAVYDELVGMLSHGCMDVLTSKSSTLPYGADTMQKMLALVRNAKGSDAGLVYHTAVVTRLLSVLAQWRFLHFHGQPSARLERDKTVYANPGPERTLLITLLTPALFLAPAAYLREISKKCVDGIINEGDWRNFIAGLLKEWEQLILSSTVVLSVNVGFLAIPGVVISNLNSNITGPSQVVIFTSPAQIASCISIVASTGSIVIGLLLIRHTSTQQNEDPAGASNYLYQNVHPRYGLEPIAIIFSLPWALLMWAMVMFSIAVLLFCFSISNLSTRIFVSVTLVMVGALIWWCIKSSWESSEERGWVSSSLRSFFCCALDHIRGVANGFFALILRRESSSLLPYGHAGNLQVIPDRERVGV